MAVEVKSYTESKLISHSFPHVDLLQQISEKKYEGFYELAQELDKMLKDGLENNLLTYLRYPESNSLFTVEEDKFPVFIFKNPENNQNKEYYKLASLSTYSPNSHAEKPSGIILEDNSYLQIDITFAHHIQTRKMYLLFASFHYGRSNLENEFYFFRYDKESDYEFNRNDPNELKQLNYKPIYHFHGNSDEPHFPVEKFVWNEKIQRILDVLKVNLKRLQRKTGEASF